MTYFLFRAASISEVLSGPRCRFFFIPGCEDTEHQNPGTNGPKRNIPSRFVIDMFIVMSCPIPSASNTHGCLCPRYGTRSSSPMSPDTLPDCSLCGMRACLPFDAFNHFLGDFIPDSPSTILVFCFSSPSSLPASLVLLSGNLPPL